MRFGLLLILIGTLTSHCAIAPFATDKSGTSLGKGVNYLDLGLSPLPYAHYAHGITDSFDAGGIFELQFGYTAALYGKYSLLDNAEDGVSVAAVAGGGVGVSGFLDTTYLFVGPTVSYRQKKIEFFIHPRFTHVRYDDIEPDDTTSDEDDDDDNSSVDLDKIDGGSFNYTQLSFGVNLHLKQVSFGVTGVTWIGDEVIFDAAPGVNVQFKF